MILTTELPLREVHVKHLSLSSIDEDSTIYAQRSLGKPIITGPSKEDEDVCWVISFRGSLW